MSHILDNPVWNALNTANKNLGKGTDIVKYYHHNISPFVGLRENTHENLITLYEFLAKEEGTFALVSENIMDIPEPWRVIDTIPLFQMVLENPIVHNEISETITHLSETDIPQMMELAKLTNPGPFEERTIDFKYYQGIFCETRLVAMAGQRMHIPPFAEISAVCTHPDFRGRGFAAQLMASQIKRIIENKEIPFLHVAMNNLGAIKIYESLGFRKRKEMYVYVISNSK
ncbi:ribosomal protein S18 acetylase RimI-like enzyme [Chryseobacterium sediminis]|uniref:Ribosomal protein S18 acetylase RimI-like enzyme n=1 Tax=Chryseobacterium sediminis TaxID=1679494 RepID=A0ABR6PYP4_9FLAO|nr:GNAT family N-acetyltransferase [Chryseobacterium sediminis]MBB6330018.1 ribosomal protein S18 acetylase RimI-like enzyme [Chryseobacterium sediminis]